MSMSGSSGEHLLRPKIEPFLAVEPRNVMTFQAFKALRMHETHPFEYRKRSFSPRSRPRHVPTPRAMMLQELLHDPRGFIDAFPVAHVRGDASSAPWWADFRAAGDGRAWQMAVRAKTKAWKRGFRHPTGPIRSNSVRFMLFYEAFEIL